MRQKKRLNLFRFALLCPWVFLLYLLFRFSADIRRINALDQKTVQRRLGNYLNAKTGEDFPLPVELARISKADFNVFIFGESSVIISDGPRFSEYLQLGLNSLGIKARVFNFGILGLDSFSIKRRLKSALERSSAKPAAVIFYLGHNDFNNAYDHVIKAAYPDFDYLIKPLYFVWPKTNLRILAAMQYRWYARLKRPYLLDLFQALDLINIDDGPQTNYDSLIMSHFRKNIAEMLGILARYHVKAVFITPIGNYSARPFGARKVSELYWKGIGEKDYNSALNDLIAAKDAELLTYDIRAKSSLTEYLTSIRSRGVFVLNLERECRAESFRFDDSNFLDYFHLKSGVHKMIAGKIISSLSRVGALPASRPD